MTMMIIIIVIIKCNKFKNYMINEKIVYSNFLWKFNPISITSYHHHHHHRLDSPVLALAFHFGFRGK
jgi:hypothetical protein